MYFFRKWYHFSWRAFLTFFISFQNHYYFTFFSHISKKIPTFYLSLQIHHKNSNYFTNPYQEFELFRKDDQRRQTISLLIRKFSYRWFKNLRQKQSNPLSKTHSFWYVTSSTTSSNTFVSNVFLINYQLSKNCSKFWRSWEVLRRPILLRNRWFSRSFLRYWSCIFWSSSHYYFIQWYFNF